MSLAQVQVLFRRNGFVGNDPTNNVAVINCNLLSSYSPRPGWLVRQKDGRSPDILYWLTFDPDSSAFGDANTIQGFWLEETSESEGMFVDIVSAEDLVEACNCVNCDSPDGNLIPGRYGGGIPAFVTPSPVTYCLTRVKTILQGGANLTNIQQVVMDYTGQLENLRVFSFNAGSGAIKMQGTSYSVPLPIGADVIVAGVCT